MRTGMRDSISLEGDGSFWLASVYSKYRKQLRGNRKWAALPAADLHWLHVKVRPQDVDVGVQVEGSGGLTLPRLPHLNTSHGSQPSTNHN